MRLVHATHTLAGSTGVQTYLLTAADAMQRNGHDVWLSSPELGKASEYGEQLGLRVAGADELPGEFDVAFVHSAIASHDVAAAHPGLPQVFVVHGRYFDNYVPPQIAGRISATVTLGAFARSRVEAAALTVPHHELRQPIDRTRFRDRSPISETPRRALILSNYLEGERLERLKQACALAGVSVRHVGDTGEGAVTRPEDAINQADIVFGKGRAIVEAMACGRAAYVYDMWGSDGWVTAETYEQLESRGFGGMALPGDPSAEEIAADIRAYSRELGAWSAETANQLHAIDDHVATLVEIARGAAANPDDTAAFAPERELARLARQSWRHEGQAHVLSEQLKDRNRRIEQLEAEVRAMRDSVSWRVTAPLRRLRRNNR